VAPGDIHSSMVSYL